jgi:hypothetical protein
METTVVRRLVGMFACVLTLLIPLAPAPAAGQDQAQPVEVTFTKWVVVVDGIRFLSGFTGGDVVGAFSGQVLVREVSADGRIYRLETEYSVEDGDRSFTALLRGGGKSCDRAFHCGPRRPRWVADRSGRARRVRYDTGSVADRVSLLWRSRGRDLFSRHHSDRTRSKVNTARDALRCTKADDAEDASAMSRTPVALFGPCR